MIKRILKMGDPTSLDHPRRTQLHRQMILGKSFLRNLYREWYKRIVLVVPAMEGYIVEIGSGGGFLKEVLPEVILLDVLSLPHLDVIADAQALPFRRGCLRAISMVNVLHHIATPARFFQMASNCIRPGGVITMIEPWSTPWSRFVYKHLHHEPFQPEGGWTFPSSGALEQCQRGHALDPFPPRSRSFSRRLPDLACSNRSPNSCLMRTLHQVDSPIHRCFPVLSILLFGGWKFNSTPGPGTLACLLTLPCGVGMIQRESSRQLQATQMLKGCNTQFLTKQMFEGK